MAIIPTPHCEIVRYLHGRVFDSESYERTRLLRRLFEAHSQGWYVVVTSHEPATEPSLYGPFGNIGRARMAARSLERLRPLAQ